MLLMPIQQGFGPSHIVGKFICIDEGFHLSDPAGKVSEVGKEALKPGKPKVSEERSRGKAPDGRCRPRALNSCPRMS